MQKKRETSVSGLIKSVNENKAIDSHQIVSRIATNTKEKLEACHLGFLEYLKKGYVHTNQNEYLTFEYDQYPKTIIINAFCESKLAGTITLTDPNFMPCIHLFKDFVFTNGKEAEVSRFAVSENYKNNKSVLSTLFDIILTVSIKILNYERLYIEVNPRHTGFYQKYLGFQVASDVIQCGRVNNAPAVLMILDLKKGDFNKPEFKNLNSQYLSEDFVASIYESSKIKNRINQFNEYVTK